ncbi:hypothetical protein NECAME_01397 [Necator americanus]|uniref:Uncharacterized protein n=1 Tax=Necator americanus TaxID=51031 RepID=W2TUK2_NECAM|nr:hypothetical protein NECAME_01397 [Necator americanus]ETN85508.1 hypothetical protein NECAME_01397 [Necator americanus]
MLIGETEDEDAVKGRKSSKLPFSHRNEERRDVKVHSRTIRTNPEKWCQEERKVCAVTDVKKENFSEAPSTTNISET